MKECMKHIADCLWWEWDAGSLLFFWKWPQQYQAWDMEGRPHYEMNNFPQFLRPQDPAKTEEYCTKMKNNMDKIRKILHIEPGTVLSLTRMFYVCKCCGLNIALWAPYFCLPIVKHTLRALLPGYSQCDMDVGEMFLNFPLHPDLRPFAGVDITHIKIRQDEEGWYQDRTIVW